MGLPSSMRRRRKNGNNDQVLGVLDNGSLYCDAHNNIYSYESTCSWKRRRRRNMHLPGCLSLLCYSAAVILLPTPSFVYSKTRPSPSAISEHEDVHMNDIINLTSSLPADTKRKTPQTPTATLSKSSPSSFKSSRQYASRSITNDSTTVDIDFFSWCQQVLGVQTLLRIESFDYYDYFRVHKDELELSDEQYYDYENTDSSTQIPSVEDYPMIKVRGLAATRDIEVDEVVISIPFHAMITVSTTIDHDPVLSRLLGPEARSNFGWNDEYYELPLLTVALLYHKRLGRSSPLYNYIQILNTSPVNNMPFLWDRKTLQQETTEGVQKIARGIKHDIREMYDAVMNVLIEKYPNVFSDTHPNDTGTKNSNIDEGEEWAYSYKNFQMLFALVNSRHWNLPILDIDQNDKDRSRLEHHKHRHAHTVVESPSASAQVPPAEQPTEDWVHQAEIIESDDEQDKIDETNTQAEKDDDTTSNMPPPKKSHSFLAPVADLLNFGPPCTRGRYNEETHTFEVKATCPFRKGQEVTFWYSDDCEDVIIANYGFTHPMVPKCLTTEQWMERSTKWKSHAENLEKKLLIAYEELDRIDMELQRSQTLLQACNCNGENKQQHSQSEPPRDQQPHATLRHGNSNGSDESHRRPGIRSWQKARHAEESELGL